jgi:ComF family protein
LLPPVCAACGDIHSGAFPLCASCDVQLPRCNQPLASHPSIDACVVAVEFREPVEGWIHRFKYPRPGIAGIDVAGGAVARALVLEAAGRAQDPHPDLVVPIPLHPARLRARGFNPAGLLAHHLARSLDLACDAHTLRRLRDTPSQTGLDRRGRQHNVRRAFACTRNVPASIWLVDDVVTTGSTLSEAARVLRRSGARRVVAVVLAATPADRLVADTRR